MGIKRVRIPKREYFSHPRLRECYSRLLIKKLNNLYDERDNAIVELECIEVYIPSVEKKIRELVDLIKSRSVLMLRVDYRSRLGRRLFFERYRPKQKNKCLFYNKCHSRILDQAHIVKKEHFRNAYGGKQKYFGVFKDHCANGDLLCPTHHRALDTKKLEKPLLEKFIRVRKRLNDRLMKDMEKESSFYKKIKKLAKRFNSKTKSFEQKEERILEKAYDRFSTKTEFFENKEFNKLNREVRKGVSSLRR